MMPSPEPRPALVDADVFSYLDRDRDGIGRHYERYLRGRVRLIAFCTVGEILSRAYRNNWGQKRLDALRFRIGEYVALSPTEQIADAWARIRAESFSRGVQMSSEDAWLAACALVSEVDIVTNNWNDFEHLSDLPCFRQAVASGFQVISFNANGDRQTSS